MKKLFFILFALIFIQTTAFAETYQLDNQHTYVLWHISHFNFSNPSGKWMADGTLVLDEKKLQDSKVNAVIHIATLTTGIKALDEHLMKPLFFDVQQYPDATFVSDKVNVTGKTTAKVHGILTVHGISKPVTLDVKLNRSGVSPITNKPTLGFTAKTVIKRSDFGMTALLPGLGDDVKIDIEAEAFA
ncbi:MAG TPA: YceI family protein [Gammaproteobacteria bacterium]|nr:YceI family protein [Gammaproteobacteria bacterium]